ncbi:MAG: response regulator [Proteobacteria bacterium]|nr:response regulator [Pseudomonadota bacterium]
MKPPSTRKLIAVVDDEPPVRKALVRVLRMENYDVVAYVSGEEFLTSIPTPPPSCAVVDVHMPGVSGFEVARSVKAMGLATRVVLISASNEPEILREANAVGAVRLLLKPFSAEVLCQFIECDPTP